MWAIARNLAIATAFLLLSAMFDYWLLRIRSAVLEIGVLQGIYND